MSTYSEQTYGSLVEAIGVNTFNRRREQGLTLKQLAKKLGKSAAWLEKFEAGTIPLSTHLGFLRKLADVLHTSVQALTTQNAFGGAEFAHYE